MSGREQYVRVCECGCGRPTLLSVHTDRRFGQVKGQPQTYIRGHAGRRVGPDYLQNEMGCWIWQGALSPAGYGITSVNRRRAIAHRVVYEQFAGPIPEGMTLDHLCYVRACVRPGHLEPVPIRENLRRAQNHVGHALRTDTCLRGHSLTDPANVHVTTKQRNCRACARERYRAGRAS